MFKKIVSITMTHIKSASKHEQVSMKEGIKRYGQAAIRAVLKEYAQLNDKKIGCGPPNQGRAQAPYSVLSFCLLGKK